MANHPFQFNFSLACRDKVLQLGRGASRSVVMGILNVTPDSFSDGGDFMDRDTAVRRAVQMIAEGARIIDVGGASSRPPGRAYGEGASPVPAQTEIERVVPVISAIRSTNTDIVISVDTYRPDVAYAAIQAGADMVNDISALTFSTEMLPVISESRAALVLMHSPHLPGAVSHEDDGYDDVLGEVLEILSQQIQTSYVAGIHNICVDPGFGFGKTMAANYRLLNNLHQFRRFGVPILVGISRKAMIGAALGSLDIPVSSNRRQIGSLAAAAIAISRGASIIRTHDVKETMDVLKVLAATETEHVT